MACCYVPSEEEVMDLSGDSTVGYCGSSMEYESDVSSDPSSVTSESTGDSDDSYGSSVEVSDTEEEIESDGDDGNLSSDTWTFVDDDCAADKLLNRYPFRPPGVAGRPRNCIPPESKPEEYVYMFLGVFLQELVDDTNIYGRRKFTPNAACPDNNHRAWVDVTLEEMKAFLGLAVNMSLTYKGDVKQYWSTNPTLTMPIFRHVFTRDRFLDIMHCLHYPALAGSDHKLKKVLYLVQHFSTQYQRFFLPAKEICVDESLIGYQGRTPATQYMPNKHHHRWGLKLWCLCDSRTGYTWNFSMYGADDNVGPNVVDKSGDVVVRLTSPLFGYGYHMYTDNFYTSIPFAMHLYSQRTYLTETTRSKRVGLPEPVKRKLAKKGDVVSYRRGPLLACAFEDRKHVVILSTHGTGRIVEHESKRHKILGTPDCVRQYNKYMGGVDLADMRIYFFQDERKSKRWNRKVFFLLFGRTLFNAYIVYKCNTCSPLIYRKFSESVVSGLIGDFRMPRTQRHKVPLKYAILNPPNPPPPDRLIYHVDHRLDYLPNNSKMQCKVCSARGVRRRVQFSCRRCLVATCPVSCFWVYHHFVDITVPE